MRHRSRFGGPGMLVLAAALLGTPALADDGLATGATSRYVLDDKATVVKVDVTLELRNTTPDRGNSYFFYNYFQVPVPAGAQKVRATSGGSTLKVRLSDTKDPSTALARISFPDLRYGRSRTIRLTYTVPGEKPRSADSTRVGPGYATFTVNGFGDPGRNTVQVVAPTSMTFDATSDDFSASEKGATTTHTVRSSDADGFWAVVSLRDPANSQKATVDLPGTSLELHGYRDDGRWTEFVAEQVTAGLPELERLIGTSWPGGLERIREDASPAVQGYDGWFDPGDNEIVIGEDLDADLIFHELSHAWVSSERFSERWVYEGLAQVLAERTVKATGGKLVSHPKASRKDRDAVALNEWGGSPSAPIDDVDSYAYPAAYAATKALVADLDDAQLAAVVSAGIRGESAYDPAGTRDSAGVLTSWARWLDILETRGGVKDAAAVFQTWALTADQRAQLAPRATARTAYAAVDAGDGDWLPPEGLRDAMTRWDFDRAAAVTEQVAELGPAVEQVQDAAAQGDLPVPEAVRETYEKAEEDEQYAALASSLPEAARAISAVGAAVDDAATDRDPVSALGASVLGVQDSAAEAVALLEEGKLDAAVTAAETASGRADRSLLVGLAGPLLAALGLLGAVLVTRHALRRRSSAGIPVDGGPLDATLVSMSATPASSQTQPASLSGHRTPQELEAFLPVLLAAPRDVGTLDLVVRRPAAGVREVLDEGELDLVVGLVGDTWAERGSSRSADGGPHPDMQLNVMSSRMVGFLAGDPDRRALAGDQLYLDLDLSHENLPAGSRLTIGDPAERGAVIEVTEQPHTGCAKFIDRFGAEAMRFVNGSVGRPLRLRGLNARVVVPGRVRPGDAVTVTRP
ncbi:hypothetical protein [Ornithinibacter aureus]|nr:hypothetical protein [Ornithinibacter aureus]